MWGKAGCDVPDDSTNYTVEITFTVHQHANEQLRSARVIRDAIKSWLMSLGATVTAVTVRMTHDGG